MSETSITPQDQTPENFFSEIKTILSDARSKTVRAVNSAMVEAYWLIGKRIVEEEQGGSATAQYGKRLLEELSKSLTGEFGKGFSLANLKNFRKFYLTYPEKGKSYTLCSLLTWSHNRLIIREKEESSRDYYLTQTQQQNWSVRTLERQIKTKTYQRLLSTQQSSDSTTTEPKTEIQLSQKEKILSQLKDETIVQYSVLKENEQLFASKYRTILPTEAELTAEIQRERQKIEHQLQRQDQQAKTKTPPV